MRTQTKCTLAICGLFIIELLPVPVSSLYSLYVVRKRPDWLPRVVDNLYVDKPINGAEPITQATFDDHDFEVTRKKCTITLATLFVIDLLVPVVIPTALYVVRRRPEWFKTVVVKLYSDKLPSSPLNPAIPTELTFEDPEVLKELEKKLAELDSKNLDIAKTLVLKTQQRNNLLKSRMR